MKVELWGLRKDVAGGSVMPRSINAMLLWDYYCKASLVREKRQRWESDRRMRGSSLASP